MPTRTPEQIRASLERNRADLGTAIQNLEREFKEATNWRKKLAEHQQEAMIAAAVAGFVVGGGIAAIGGLFGRRGKKKKRR